MNKFDEAIKKIFIKELIKHDIIREKDGKYYSRCALGEEVTVELKNMFEDD